MKKSKPTLWGLNLLFFILLLENVGKLFDFSIMDKISIALIYYGCFIDS
ncbi:hypothetical protein [Arachidicoccus ginsenosidivorans]|nr:hypothetical protein [Arachidicoccus ginsenosidivorans]